MQLTPEQFEQIAAWLPRQRGNVSLDNLQVLNAILHVAANGCKWRAMPESYGNWHTIYTRMSRWSRAGVLDRVFEQLQRQRLMHVRIEAVSLDSTIMRAHSGCGRRTKKKRSPGPRAQPRRLEHQAASGCRGCAQRHHLQPHPGTSGRCARRPAVDRSAGAAPRRPGGAAHGQRLRSQRHPGVGLQLGAAAGGAAQPPAAPALDLRPSHSTADATKSSACSDGSKLGVGFSRATTSSTPCSLHSSRSP